MNMEQEMAQRLASLDLQVFQFTDESHLHIGHAGSQAGGGHYAIVVVSEQFRGVSRINRQRKVQDLLADLFADKKIHALSIRAQTPEEHLA